MASALFAVAMPEGDKCGDSLVAAWPPQAKQRLGEAMAPALRCLPSSCLRAFVVSLFALRLLLLQRLQHGVDILGRGVAGDGVRGRGDIAALLADAFQ